MQEPPSAVGPMIETVNHPSGFETLCVVRQQVVSYRVVVYCIVLKSVSKCDRGCAVAFARSGLCNSLTYIRPFGRFQSIIEVTFSQLLDYPSKRVREFF